MDQLEAGIELDTQVAERVMGWRRSGYAYVDAEDRVICAYGCPPDFSSDIATAWRVVEKLRRRGLNCSVDIQCSQQAPAYRVVFAQGRICRADTAPLAICRAALKAVEEQHAD